MLQPALLLTAHVLVLFSLQSSHAADVFLDAQGLIAERRRRKRPGKTVGSERRSKSAGSRPKVAERNSVAKGGRVAKSSKSTLPSKPDPENEPAAADPEEEELMILEMLEDHSISKSERRRLQKQLKRLERRAA